AAPRSVRPRQAAARPAGGARARLLRRSDAVGARRAARGPAGDGQEPDVLRAHEAPRSPRRVTFEEHVQRVLDSLPPRLAEALENVAVVVAEESPDDPDLFGLWETDAFMPDKITIFRKPLISTFPDPQELEE